jgi:UDP-3-O-[3-hydroxymyristoyl] glucosamine N-acyltransferase
MTLGNQKGTCMQIHLSELCRRADLTDSGGADIPVTGVNALEAAGPGELAYSAGDDQAKQVAQVLASTALAVVVQPGFPALEGRRLLYTAKPRLAFVYLSELFAPLEPWTGIDPKAAVDPSAALGDHVSVGPCAVVGPGARVGAGTRIGAGAVVGAGVSVGADCRVGANVNLMPGVSLGDRCNLHPGVTVGGDGFGFVWAGDHHHKVPQLGTVVIEDDVEIGSNSCVDRATFGVTRIGRGTKIDNLVHVAHNCEVGEHCILVAQAGLAGSVTLGRGAMLSGQVAVTDHISVGAGARIGGQSGVTGDVAPGEVLFGTPARPLKRTLREHAALGRLPDLLKTVKRQEAAIEALTARLAALEAACNA